MPLNCYATKRTVKVFRELACIYYLLQTLCSTHEEWTWQKNRGRFQSQIPTAEGMSSAVGYRLPRFAVHFLDYTQSFQWFSGFMEILLKQPIFLQLKLSVQLLVAWWPEVSLKAIVSTPSNHMEAPKVERTICGQHRSFWLVLN